MWRKDDQETADKLARRKAGEYLDTMELKKVLKEREEKMDREKREQKREKVIRLSIKTRGTSYYGDFTPGRSGHGDY